ncbi:MAG: adenosylcobalamin-dependent ribonucleoside-diphosphate reductase, partial [Ktedonobacterales bacterium]
MHLSENALRVLEARYLRRDTAGTIRETPEQLFARVARAVAHAELLLGDAGQAASWEERFHRLLTSLDFLPNSPTLMNAGTPLGQLSACFVLPLDDSMESIFSALRDMALVQRTGGGTGYSFGQLRPAGDLIASTGGTASGPVSFMEIFDSATEHIKLGGKRRGANMGVLPVHHPDILTFIDAKRTPGILANFNLSVGVTDTFMRAVDQGDAYDLLHPADSHSVGHLNAREVFARISDAAWATGDPGLIFLDTINRANPTPSLGAIQATNPCGEVPLLPYESCNLGSIHLAHFLTDRHGQAHIDWSRLREVVHEAIRFLDDVLVVNRYPLPAIEPAGSIRRMKETIGDIDLLVSSDRPTEVIQATIHLPLVKEVLLHGPTKCSILTQDNMQIDVRSITPEEYGSALQYFTGSKDHNIALRALAQARGWKLSEYGLFDAHDQRLAGRAESDIYHMLGLEWIPPELRENQGEIEAAKLHRLPHLVEASQIRGDLHVHTDWSDGHDAPERMVQAAISRGYQYMAFTDHSRSLRVAGGLSIERVRQQQRLIDRLNAHYAPFHVLHSAEVDILPDGALDYPEEVLADFDFVTASIHSALGQSRDVMTARLLHALGNPYVDMLNHPTGRRLRRAGYDVDLGALIQAAVEHEVVLEIDGQPDRLDLDDVGSRRANAAG